MSYYQGDYYRGDFWSKLGKGIKKGIKAIGKVAQTVAPVAGILLPAVGAATLVGRGVAAANKIKRAGRDARSLARSMATPAELASPAFVTGATAPIFRATGRSEQRAGGTFHQYAMEGSGRTVMMPADASQREIQSAYLERWDSPRRSTTTAARRTRAARAGYRRRKAVTRKRTTTRRRTRRRRTRRAR